MVHGTSDVSAILNVSNSKAVYIILLNAKYCETTYIRNVNHVHTERYHYLHSGLHQRNAVKARHHLEA